MRILLAGLLILTCAVLVQAQSVNITFGWDGPPEAPGPAGDPVKYRLCLSSTAPPYATLPADRKITEAGTELQATVLFTRGSYYVFATAFQCAVLVNGVCQGTEIAESGPSNVLKIDVQIPPGNPSNYRIRSTQVAETDNGQTVTLRAED